MGHVLQEFSLKKLLLYVMKKSYDVGFSVSVAKEWFKYIVSQQMLRSWNAGTTLPLLEVASHLKAEPFAVFITSLPFFLV